MGIMQSTGALPRTVIRYCLVLRSSEARLIVSMTSGSEKGGTKCIRILQCIGQNVFDTFSTDPMYILQT